MSGIEGKVVIITGASSGLGEATARLLAERGAKLMLGARRGDRLKKLVADIEKAGGTALAHVVDVADNSQVQAMVKATLETYGRVDVLLNNAGLMPLSPLGAVKVAEWDRMVDVNLKGVLYGMAAVLPVMYEQKSGHIINMASIAGIKVMPTGAVYCATKHAVRALTEGLRMESDGSIRATLISPGAVDTELTSTISHEATAKGTSQAYEIAIGADAVARAVAYAIEQPADVDINEIVIRPARQRV